MKRHIYTTISIIISIAFFLVLTTLAENYVEISNYKKRFLGAGFIVLIGLVELSFTIFISSYYGKRAKDKTLIHCFFRVTSIQFFLFFAAELVRLFIFLPVIRASEIPFYTIWQPINYVIILGGLGLGIVFAVLTKFFKSMNTDRSRMKKRVL